MATSACEYEVIVQLKKEVLDPEGRAIQETLARLGQDCVRSVVVSKRFVLEIDPAKTQKNGEDVARDIAREFLANPVSQTVTVKKLQSGDR